MNFRQDSIRLIVGVLFLQVLSACSRNREIIVTGFTYKDETVKLFCNGNYLAPVDLITYDNKTGLQFFYEKRRVSGNKVGIKVTIDAAGIRKLDTLLLIPGSYKIPLISFVAPTKAIPGREVFIADDNDTPKY